jgi:mannose-1-phosphate guanylyltransferase
MLPVCDLPILRFGIARLVAAGICDIVINLHHRGDVIVDEIGDGARFGARIQYSREDEILGTGGGLKRALPMLDPEGSDQPFISLNGKLIFEVDLAALADAYRRDPSVLGVMVVRRTPDAEAWGAVAVTGDPGRLRITDILGKGTHMFCGVHITRPSVVRRLPDGEACMIRQGYLPWLKGGETVAAFEQNTGYFAEHSTPARYLEGNRALLRASSFAAPPGRLAGVDPTARIAPSAVIREPVKIGAGAVIGAGATIGPEVVVGSGANVLAGARLERCVVWAGAEVGGEVRDAIVSAGGILSASE